MSKGDKQQLGLIIIGSGTLTSFLLFNGLNESEVFYHWRLKVNPEQDPFKYYLTIGFLLISSITSFIMGSFLLFSKSTPVQDKKDK